MNAGGIDEAEAAVHPGFPQSDAVLAHDTVATLYAGYLSAERGGADTRVPVAPLEVLSLSTAPSGSSRHIPAAGRAPGI